MKEEDIIRRKAGSDNPFKVPDGYFGRFTATLTNRLPEQQPRKAGLSRRLRPAWYAAATVCGIALCGSLLLRHNRPDTEPSAIAHNYSEESLDELLDYAMTDNMEIAYYLTTAD